MTGEKLVGGESGGNVVELRNVTKRYPGVTALKDVSIHLRPNEVLGLVGENGAGKSTLLKILTGVEQPDEGELLIRGVKERLRGVADAADHGLGMVFQEQSLVPNLTVGENIFLGNEGRSARFGWIRRREIMDRARAELESIGSPVDPGALVSDLRFAQRQMVEIAKVLALRDRTLHEPVILLDEPTSVFGGDEVKRLLAMVEDLRRQASVIFISHRLDEVLQICSRIYVMRDGEVVSEHDDPQQVDVQDLHREMVGEAHIGAFYDVEDQKPPDKDHVVLSVQDLCLEGEFHNVSFDIHAGEVLTIAGVEGAGREALTRAIIGASVPTSGQVLLEGKPVRFRTPAQAAAHGVGYVPSDRRGEGAILPMSVRSNVTIAYPAEITRAGRLDLRKEADLVRRWVKRLQIRAPSIETPVRNLSGGNQQKVVIAKWLISKSLKILILSTPTRGLDIGAKAEVHRLIRELAADGMAILMLADTLAEGIALSQTILTMKDGRVTGHFDAPPGRKPTQVDILERMV